MKSFAQFGSDLDASTVAILKHGEVLLQILRQEQYKPRQLSRQVFELFMAKEKYLDNLEISEVRPTLENAYKYVSLNHPEIFKSIDQTKEIGKDIQLALVAAVTDFFNINK